ncbi:MAG: mechanosensitive ion channel [Nitrospiraceae bacterium]|nr:mechanosensitive ion channel [Nitrospiraceae bacterium]
MDFLGLLGHYYKIFQNISVFKALTTVIIYLLLAKAADIFIDRILKRLAGLTEFRLDDKIISSIHGPICWTIVLLGILHGMIWLNLGPPWGTIFPGIAKTLILSTWWVMAIRTASWLIEHSLPLMAKRGDIGRNVFFLFKNIIRIAVLTIGIVWGLAIWDVDLTPLFASAGIVGIAVALAAKDTLANFFGGISIFIDKSFKIGDYIILDSGERGEVVDIGIRSTRIKTRDDILITIPNSILSNSKIINESAPVPRFRIRVPVGVAYESDLEKVENILVEVAKSNSLVSNLPEPRARLRLFADFSINFELLCWVNSPRDKGLAIHQLLAAIYKKFEKEAISIPFPQNDVHLFSPKE